jgi:hypothetical protein
MKSGILTTFCSALDPVAILPRHCLGLEKDEDIGSIDEIFANISWHLSNQN